MLLLWMVENLLPNSSRDKKREEWGEEYFNLVSRSFFQRSSTGGSNFYIWNNSNEERATKFVMHDLMHDMAKFVAKEYSLQLEEGNSSQTMKKTRHLSYVTRGIDPYKRFDYVIKSLVGVFVP